MTNVLNEIDVIWKAGDGEMPGDAQRVVEAARSDLLFQSLDLPENVVSAIRYNSEKKSVPVSRYISSLLQREVAQNSPGI